MFEQSKLTSPPSSKNFLLALDSISGPVSGEVRKRLMLRRGAKALLIVLALGALFALARTALGQGAYQFPAYVNLNASSTQSVPLTMQSAGTLSAIQVLTGGTAGLDYSAAGGSCYAGVHYSVGDSCTVSVAFTAQYPGIRTGAVVLKDGSGVPLATTLLYGVGVGPLSVATAGELTTIAGNGAKDESAPIPGTKAVNAAITLPVGVAVDGGGNVYFTDSGDNYIGKIDTSGNLTIIADGLDSPAAILVDGAGNVYFTEIGHSNNLVREIVAATGLIKPIAGTGAAGYSSDGVPATSAALSSPQGLAMDPSGNLYIADTGNNTIRFVRASDGTIQTFAGSSLVAGFSGDGGAALSAELKQPLGLAFATDGSPAGGSLYVADSGSNRVRKIDGSGNITTVAGSGDAAGYTGDSDVALSATLDLPSAIALDAAGDLFISDENNDVVRKVNVKTNVITTLAGQGTSGWNGDGLNADGTTAALSRPTDVVLDASGDLFIADWTNLRVREVYGALARIQYKDIKVTNTSPPVIQRIDNDGNAPLHISGINPVPYQGSGSINSAVDPLTTTCPTTPTVAILPGAECNIGVEFKPTVVGSPVNGQINVVSDSPSTPVVIDLFGNSLSIEPSTTALTSTPNPSAVGQAVTFTATISSLYTGTLTGTVQLFDTSNSNALIGTGSVTATSARTTTISVSTLALGVHVITAVFTDSDGNNTSSTLPLPGYTQTVKQAAALALTSTPNPAAVYDSVTFTVTASELPAGGILPTGNIVFSDSVAGSPLNGATVPLSGGSASISTALLAAGSHTVTATYAGDMNNTAATSNVTEVIYTAATTMTLATSNPSVPLTTLVTFTATVAGNPASTPTGNVIFKDGTKTIGTVPLPLGSNTVSLSTSTLSPGIHAITAAYQGDADYAPSSASLDETVNKIATGTAVVSSANPANAGATVSFTVTVAAASSTTPNVAITGTVSLMDGATTVVGTGTVAALGSGPATATVVIPVSSLAIGAHAITAVYTGDTNYVGSSSAAIPETISLATSSNVLTASSAAPIATTPVTLTSTLTSNGGTPTGSVTFFDGVTAIGTGTLVKGVGTLTTTTLAVGTHTITSVYGGDASDGASTSNAVTITVVSRTTSVTLASSQNPLLTLSPVTITATVANSGGPAATGTVNFSHDGTVVATIAVDASGTAALNLASLPVGTHSFVATYSGDAVDLASSSTPLSEVVQLRATTDVLTTSATSLTGGQQITLISVVRWTGPATPTGSVTFFTGTDTLATAAVDATGVATVTALLSGTSANVSSSYSGDANYAPSISSVVLVTIGPAPDFSMVATPPAFTLVSKQHLMVNLTIASVKDFTDTLSLGCLGLPQAATCSFSSDQMVLTAGGSQSVTLTVDTGDPLLAGQQVKNEDAMASKLVMACLLPGGLLLGLMGLRFRKMKGIGGLVLLLILAGLSAAMMGCGTVNAIGTPAGVYHFSVSATGKTGVTQTLPITMTVTQ